MYGLAVVTVLSVLSQQLSMTQVAAQDTATAAAATAEPIPIISYKDDVNADGTYEYGYEAGNGIKIDANGNGERQSGSVKYIDPDGNPVEWTYTADVNGYQPQGAGIPAIPEYIVRALQYIRDHSTPAPPQADGVEQVTAEATGQ